MAYKPTGNPPGRPRSDGLPAGAPAKHAKPGPPEDEAEAEAAEVRLQGPNPVVSHLTGYICPECFPHGWPAKATGLGCRHGIWTRRA